MKKLLSKYKYFLILLSINILMLFFYPQISKASITTTYNNFVEILLILIPIFILVGLLDVWIDRQTMIRLMGDKSGLQGVLIAFFLGSVTAIPIYALFPIVALLLKKGSKISNVFIFLCSSCNIRIPLLLFEILSMGWKFMLIRYILNIIQIIVIAYLIEKLLTQKDKKEIYLNAENKIS
ncbi:MAG: permease [Clostridia bacterium]|nr:permease [Clostridia bacterium]